MIEQYPKKRRHPRIKKELVVVLSYRNLNHFIIADAKDISIGGMKLHMKNPPTVGTHVKLQFQPEYDVGILEINAEVKWIGKADRDNLAPMGIEFLGMDSSIRNCLEDIINMTLANQ